MNERKIREILGQDFENPQYERIYINGPEKYKHLRINLSCCNNNDEENKLNIENNKKICDLFNKDFKNIRMIVRTWKGFCYGLIVHKMDYEKYNLELFDNSYDDTTYTKIKYIYYNEYEGGSGTCKILFDLVNKCLEYDN